jgi:hypothetical protein
LIIKSKADSNLLFAEKQFYDTQPSIQPLSTFDVPKNFDRRTGPPPSSLSDPEFLLLDLCLFSFFDRLDLDFDLFDALSSSSLLEEYEDDEEELDGEDLLECCNGIDGEYACKKINQNKKYCKHQLLINIACSSNN